MPHMLLVLLCLLLVTPDSARSAASGRIEGVVQQAGQAIANHRIMLIRFGPDQEVNRTPGETDAEGGFAFEGLETGDTYTYVVGIRYEGTLFRSQPLQLSDTETKAHVVVQVGEAGTPAMGSDGESTQLHIPHHIMAIVWREGRLDVREIVTIQSPGSPPDQGQTTGQANTALHLPLPEGYRNLRDFQGIPQEHVRSDRFGLYLTQPLKPGTHRFIYTYDLPMTERVRTLLLRQSLPTAMIDIFTDAKHLIAASNLQFLGEVPIESHQFLHFRGMPSEPGTRNWLQITRLGTGVSHVLRFLSYTLIIAIAIAGLAMPLYSQWRRASHATSSSSAKDIQAWRIEYSRLLMAIAQLDNDRAAGALDEPIYRQRRQSYKQQLRRVTEELHRTNQSLDIPFYTTGAMQKGLP